MVDYHEEDKNSHLWQGNWYDGQYVESAVGVGLSDGGGGGVVGVGLGGGGSVYSLEAVAAAAARPPSLPRQTTSPVGRCWWQRPPNSLTSSSSSAPHNHQSQSSQCPALVPSSCSQPDPTKPYTRPRHPHQLQVSHLIRQTKPHGASIRAPLWSWRRGKQ